MANDQYKINAFLRAAYEGNTDLVLQLIDDDISVNVENQAGLTALHFASKTGNVDLADELIMKGAEVNSLTQKGFTPLHVACLMGHAEVVKLLLLKGATVNCKANNGDGEAFTPLYMAAQIGNQEIVILLLANGADTSIQTQNGSTAREVSRQQGHLVVAEILFEYEQRIGEQNKENKLEGEDISSEDTVCNPEQSPNHRKINTPPVCQDVCLTPRNSPKHGPKYLNGTSD